VIELLQSLTQEVLEELMASDEASAKIGKAYFEYMALAAENSRISEQAYLNMRVQRR
jgi:TRAP-type mannitol/chloroaromatic compound transport system substrate-binding protein